MRVLREFVPPLLTLYALVLAALFALRRGWPPRRRTRSLREVASTIAGGYAAFLLIVLVFMTLATGDVDAIVSAATEGTALLGVVLAVFAALSALDARLERWRDRRVRR